MLIELAVFLCLAGIVTPSGLHYASPGLHSTSSHTNIPVEANILQSQQGAQYPGIPANAHIYFASDSSYSINPAEVKTLTAPVAVQETAKKVTVEGHQHVIAHPPTAPYVSSYRGPMQTVINRPAVQYVSSQVGQSHAVQNTAHVAHRSVTALPPPAAYITSTVAPQPVHHVQTVAHPPTVQYVPTIPAAKKVTVEAHQSVTVHPPRPAYVAPPPVVARPAVQYISVPVAHAVHHSGQIASNEVHTHETVTAHPPIPSYVTSTVAPPAVQHIPTVINRPAVQYVSAPVSHVKPVLVQPVAPLPLKTVTIESHQSVTAHPPTPTVAPVHYVQAVAHPPAIQYPATPFVAGIHHAHTSSSVVPKPIPVPVIFSADALAQYVGETKQVQPVAAISQPIPVPVLLPKSEAHIRYQHKGSSPVVYTKSIVDKDHASADIVASHVTPGYSKAVVFSPASAVSSVSFNGNGFSYGW